jgi:hypothetical protein
MFEEGTIAQEIYEQLMREKYGFVKKNVPSSALRL